MKESSRHNKDFLVSFFVRDCVYSRLLSEVVKCKNDRLFLEAMGIPFDFCIPFYQNISEAESVYMIQQKQGGYNITANGQICDDYVIQSGDYFVFERMTDQQTVKALAIDVADIQVGYMKYEIYTDTNISIGRNLENDISFNLTNAISREKHAAIHIDSNGTASIEDIKRNIGVYVNGKLAHSQQLNIYDEIFIMGLSIIYMGDFIAVRGLNMNSSMNVMREFIAKEPVDTSAEKNYFVSAPRIMKSLDRDVVEIDAPPSPFTEDKTPLLLTIGPSLTMSLVMIVSLSTSIINAVSGGQMSTIISSAAMAISMLMGSLMWPNLLRKYQKERVQEEEEHRKRRYKEYISDIEKDLVEKKDRSVRLWNDVLCPSPDIMSSMLDDEGSKLRLWERSYADEDFLNVRIGLGSRPFQIQIKTPRQGFQLYEDRLRDLPSEIAEKYEMLSNVPMSIDMRRNRTIGIVGHRKYINTLLHEIILNIISLHSCYDAKLVLIVPQKQMQTFEKFKHVPHIWSDDKKVRYYATTADEVHNIFNAIDEKIKSRYEAQEKKIIPVPHYVVIVSEPQLIEQEPFVRYLEDADNNVGITTIFAYGDIAKLPKSCQTIIQSDDNRTGYYIKNENENKFTPFLMDAIDAERVDTFASALSQLPIKRDVRSMSVVDRISFLQMYKAGNVDELDIERHWDNNNSAKSLAAPIGVVAGGEAFRLDIHESYHGCHGLVAGTTGSGKSEFLQAYILSMAINYSPREVAFVLVDFKGADMARPFMAKENSPALPHLAATISNLSGNVLYRALVSLEAEIKSRQRIFNQAAAYLGVDKLDINSYHKYYKGGRLQEPLPHLIIIIDEFAQLKTQQPEFLAQLINVAQVGRSLGIHLILATQKPTGIVDPQIMSNSRFKVCLKVADKQDSVEMIGRPDSALIKNPGRLYLQVGYDEIYECVQSGYSGADYAPTARYVADEEITVHMTDHTATQIHTAKMDLGSKKSDKTQLEAIVAKLVALGQKKHIAAKPLWKDMLPEKVLLGTLASGAKGLCTASVGLADYVRMQEQKTLTIDFAKNGHIALYGASGTGKTTFLQTLVYSMVCEYGYSPEELNLYVLDFGGRNLGYLENLPHTGGVVFADDESKLMELTSMLSDLIDERKRIFAENNCGTFVDYRAVGKTSMPSVVVMIDNFAAFRDRYMEISDQFVDFISAGKAAGVYFVLTGSTRNAIYYKITENISTYFTLKMNDPSNYMDIHNVRPPVVPEDISGRGITVVNKEVIEFQTAVAADGDTEADRIKQISARYQELAEQWSGYMPIRLGETEAEQNVAQEESPSQVSYASSVQSNRNIPPEAISDDEETLVLGVSRSGASSYGIRLADDYKLCLCWKDEKDVAEYCVQLINNITQYNDRRVVLVDVEQGRYESLAEENPDCRYIRDLEGLDEFIEELKPELNDRLDDPYGPQDHLFIVIPEFNAFFDAISDEQAEFMRKVMRYIDHPKYKIYFVSGFDVNRNKNNDMLFLSLIVNARNYVICSGSYADASDKLEKLPGIYNVKPNSSYLCLGDNIAEVRW